MPRAGWLAAGGVIAGVCAPFLPAPPGISFGLAACLLVIAVALVMAGRQTSVTPRPSRSAAAAASIGAAIVVARLALG